MGPHDWYVHLDSLSLIFRLYSDNACSYIQLNKKTFIGEFHFRNKTPIVLYVALLFDLTKIKKMLRFSNLSGPLGICGKRISTLT